MWKSINLAFSAHATPRLISNDSFFEIEIRIGKPVPDRSNYESGLLVEEIPIKYLNKYFLQIQIYFKYFHFQIQIKYLILNKI